MTSCMYGPAFEMFVQVAPEDGRRAGRHVIFGPAQGGTSLPDGSGDLLLRHDGVNDPDAPQDAACEEPTDGVEDVHGGAEPDAGHDALRLRWVPGRRLLVALWWIAVLRVAWLRVAGLRRPQVYRWLMR